MRFEITVKVGLLVLGLMLLSACGSSDTSTVGTACSGGDSASGTTAGTGTSANTSGVLCGYATKVYNSSPSVNACAISPDAFITFAVRVPELVRVCPDGIVNPAFPVINPDADIVP